MGFTKIMVVRGKMYLISDPHFNHKNIIKYENRLFKNLDDMRDLLICDWNNVVKKKDYIWVLGDFCFGSKEIVTSIVSRLNGRIHLINGNHDGSHSYSWWRDTGVEFFSKYPIIYEDFYILSHRPVDDLGSGFYNIHGHLHSKQYTADDRHFNVSVDSIGNKPLDFRVIKEKLINRVTSKCKVGDFDE